MQLIVAQQDVVESAPPHMQAVTQLEEERRRRNSLEAGAARCWQVLGEVATIVAAEDVSGQDKIAQISAKLQQVDLDYKK